MRAALVTALVVVGTQAAPARAQSRGLPDDPCEVMTPAQMAAATGLDVASATRVETIAETVRAAGGARPSGAGTMCAYDTGSPFGQIAIEIPRDRRVDVYEAARAAAFARFPGSTSVVAGVGDDAWLAGGTSLHVLVRDADYFTVTAQNFRPVSRDVLVTIARWIVDNRVPTSGGGRRQ